MVTEQENLLAIERERRKRAEALYQAGMVLTSTLNYEEVLDRILEQLKELIPYDAASIMLIKGDKAQVFRWRGYAKFGTSASKLSHSYDIAATFTLRFMQESGRPLIIPHVENDARWADSPQEGWGKSYVGAPMRGQKQIIGFLNMHSATPGFFEQVDVMLLERFAEQAGIALENARLHDQTRQEVIERVRAFKQERNFISTVLDTAGALVMVLSSQGRILRFNRACEQTTGYVFEQVRGKYWWDLFLPRQEIEDIKVDFDRLLLDQRPREYENYWITQDGRLRLVAWTNTTLPGPSKQVEYVLCTGMDLTERRQAEEALKSSEERFRQVISSISDHVYVSELTQDGRHLNRYISPHVETLTGYPTDKFLSDWSFWPSTVIHPVDRMAAAAQAANLGMGRNSEMEYRLVRADGKVIWVRDSARVEHEGASTIIYGLVSNVDERKRAEEALKSTNQQLQALTNRLQAELILAQKIQQSLLPLARPSRVGLDLACYSVPAREVGGDFYAYHAFGNKDSPDRFAIAVGDISGKGMPAALLMAVSLTALQTVIISRTFTPQELLAQLDQIVEPYTRTTHQNCALCYAIIEEDVLRVANAGCIPPLICRNDGEVEWVEAGGLPLGVGIGAAAGYSEVTYHLQPGDLVIFTSDGVVEATDAVGNLFGFERLEQLVASGPQSSAETMLAYLQTEIAAFTGNTEPHDDLTIVVLKT